MVTAADTSAELPPAAMAVPGPCAQRPAAPTMAPLTRAGAQTVVASDTGATAMRHMRQQVGLLVGFPGSQRHSRYLVDSSSPFRQLMEAVCLHLRLPISQVRFVFDGDDGEDLVHDTVWELGLEDGDYIEVCWAGL